MLAIHWSPVKNTKQILRQGISKTGRGTFCFPMTGNSSVDKWWAQAFRAWRPRTQYNGFVFRVREDDLPASFGHWAHGTDTKPLQTLVEIERVWRDSLIFRIGERFVGYDFYPPTLGTSSDIIRRVGADLVAEHPRIYAAVLDGDPAFLSYVFEDYELVLSHSIAAKRILRVIPGSNRSGREIARDRKAASFKNQVKESNEK